jgi:probable poly-beta-1,6-N-acetyl-D-glucosamine export protein
VSWELSNFLRAIATTLVIWIHASHYWWFGADYNVSFSAINFEVFINTFINQAGRFTIPLFVILSGFGLAKTEGWQDFKIGKFFHKRCLRILPPYFFFSIIYLVVKPEFRFAEISEKFQQLMHALSDGSGDYHLYFLVIILKCYLCYPLIRLLQFSPRRLGILIGLLIVLTSLNWTNSLFGWFGAIAPYLSSFYMLFWLPYSLIGIWIAKEPEWTNRLVQKLSLSQWGIVWAIATSLEVGEFYISATILGLAEPAGHSSRPTVVLLSLTSLLWAMSWQPFLKNWQKLIPETHLNMASAASFTTYFNSSRRSAPNYTIAIFRKHLLSTNQCDRLMGGGNSGVEAA